MDYPAYIVLESSSLSALCDEVNNKIIQGYRPAGGIAVMLIGRNDFFYLQAMFQQYAAA